MDYTRLSLAEAKAALLDVARDTSSTFGTLDIRQLNWRPDAKQWSVAQCFEHLLTANRLMFAEAERALHGSPTSLLQRMPVLPRILGGMLIRSQAPDTTRRFTAPRNAQPTASEIAPDVLQRFIDQQHEAAQWVSRLDEREVARRNMGSPFVPLVAYSVLDGVRLAVAHDHRHFQQARRVTESKEFPKS